MISKLMMPIGYENFKELRNNNFYYVDKTKFVERLINNYAKVKIFTRPHHFGKTLNMSMLRYFFEIGTDTSLFDGLYISNNKELCEKYMGKYPVIFLSFKNVDGSNYEETMKRFIEIIGCEAIRFKFLLDSNELSLTDKERYRALISKNNNCYSMDKNMLRGSLKLLSSLLYKHYNKSVIILIDEYETPLYKAFNKIYYEEMVSLILGMYGEALKGNEALEFGILTGCIEIPKKHIYGGFNNFVTYTITDTRYDNDFGFTENEVKDLLAYYNYEDYFQETKQWYDGYRFGNANIYCPWDVINYVDRIKDDINAFPESYWINTSGNDLVKRFIDKADKTTRDEIERLIEGQTIEKKIRLDLTYDEIDNSIDNLWSVLFTTGYLTFKDNNIDGTYELMIPNREIKEVL